MREREREERTRDSRGFSKDRNGSQEEKRKLDE